MNHESRTKLRAYLVSSLGLALADDAREGRTISSLAVAEALEARSHLEDVATRLYGAVIAPRAWTRLVHDVRRQAKS